MAPCTVFNSPMSEASAVPETARQGRDNQRYSPSGERLVAGCAPSVDTESLDSTGIECLRIKFLAICSCVPIRWVEDGRAPSAVQVMLISSSGGSGWVFPKGGWELDETAESAAMRETVEEGGVRGELDPIILGRYPYSNRKTSPTRKGCIAHMFVMVVKEELSVWPESQRRERRWVRYL